MDISASCLPPIQPTIMPRDRQHPRFAEYMAYRSALACKLVTADTFQLWLSNTIERENCHDVVFRTQPGATLADGWYKHKFGPDYRLVARLGPFSTQEEAAKS